MNNQKTITEQKAGFIRSQVRYLEQPLRPSPSWQDHPVSSRTNKATETDDNGDDHHDGIDNDKKAKLPDKTVQDILTNINSKIKAHNRLVFSAQSQRHVAEQIDALYWNEVTAVGTNTLVGSLRHDTNAEENVTWVKTSTDLSQTEAIISLPEQYSDLSYTPHPQRDPQHPASSNPSDSLTVVTTTNQESNDEYTLLRQSLIAQAQKRNELRQRIDSYRHLTELLTPFEQAQSNVQPNLVTKDGELARELERMKVLVARVGAGLSTTGTRPRLEHDNDNENGNENERQTTRGQSTTSRNKLADILELG